MPARNAFVILAALMQGSQLAQAAPEQAFGDAIRLLRTESVYSPAQSSAASSESPFFGAWVSNEELPDGRPYVSSLELKPDLSFSIKVRTDAGVLFAAQGAWLKKGSQLHWTYLSSQPSLPAANREDDEEIVSVDATTLVLKSGLTGKVYTYQRESATSDN